MSKNKKIEKPAAAIIEPSPEAFRKAMEKTGQDLTPDWPSSPQWKIFEAGYIAGVDAVGELIGKLRKK